MKKVIQSLISFFCISSAFAQPSYTYYKDYFAINSVNSSVFIYSLMGDKNINSQFIDQTHFMLTDGEKHMSGSAYVIIASHNYNWLNNRCDLVIKDGPYMHPTIQSSCVGALQFEGATYEGDSLYSIIINIKP